MEAHLHGQITGPALAVVGVWDPLLPDHEALFAQACAEARARGLAPIALAIDPDPGVWRHGAARWSIYDDFPTRLRHLRGCSFDAVLHLDFAAPDLDATAADFFDLVCGRVDLRELWLGAQQSLGNGAAGDAIAVAALAAARGIALERLPAARLPSRAVRAALDDGRLGDAIAIVGRPPRRSRPRDGQIRLAWHPGRYRALPIRAGQATPGDTTLTIELAPRPDGPPSCAWPDRTIDALAFLAGPGDVSESDAITEPLVAD